MTFLIEEYVAQYVELMSARIKKQVGRTLQNIGVSRSELKKLRITRLLYAFGDQPSNNESRIAWKHVCWFNKCCGDDIIRNWIHSYYICRQRSCICTLDLYFLQLYYFYWFKYGFARSNNQQLHAISPGWKLYHISQYCLNITVFLNIPGSVAFQAIGHSENTQAPQITNQNYNQR